MSTQAINRAKSRPQPKNGDSPGKKKFGLVLQGAAALGAYEAGAIEYLYESGMECAIVLATPPARTSATIEMYLIGFVIFMIKITDRSLGHFKRT
jgi:hypothetical protein